MGAWVLAVVAAFLAGGAHLAFFRAADTALPDPGGERTTLAGTVCTLPEAMDDGVRFVLCRPGKPSAADAGTVSGPRRVRIQWQGVSLEHGAAVVALLPGDRVRVMGRLYRPGRPGNPWAFDSRRYWAARRLPYVLYAEGPEAVIEDDRQATPGPLRWLAGVRQRARLALRRTLDDQAWGLASALLFGDRGDLDPDSQDWFRRSGMAHLLAVSGMHVGILAWLVERALRPLLPGRLSRYGVLALLMAVTVVWSGGRAPVVRAAVGLVMVGLQGLVHLPPAPLNALGGAALLLLLYHPYQLWDPGFGLTFAAAAAIALCAEPLVGLLPSGPLYRWVGAPLGVGLAAFLGTAPLLAAHFGHLQPLSILMTPVAVPFLALFLAVGVAALPLVAAVPATAALAAYLLQVPAAAITTLARWGADLWAGWTVPAPAPALTLAYEVLLALCLADFRPPLVRKRRPRPLRPARLALAVMGTACLVVWSTLLAVPRHLEVVFADVGQGDGIIVGVPPGLWLVVDGGGVGLGSSPAGARFALEPYLTGRGARPDLVVASHAHADHAAGITHLLQHLPRSPLGLLEPGLAVPGRVYGDLLEAGKGGEVPRVVPLPGDIIPLGRAVLTVLGPLRPHLQGTDDDLNNNSLVLRLDYNHLRLLLPGDIHGEAEERLLRAWPKAWLRAHILKVAHHGSATSTSPSFLRAVSPRVAVVQVGRGNRFGHPHPQVMVRLDAHRVITLRTDTGGAVILRSDGRRLCLDPGGHGGGGCTAVESLER